MSFRLAAVGCLAALAAPASAAERNFSVTGFDRIRVDGPYRVRLTTGVAPFAKATGTPAALNGVSVEVQGRTLIVRANSSGWGGYPGKSAGPVEISLGTHELARAWLNGAGALSIDKVRGQTFDLAVQGSGQIAVGKLHVDALKTGISGSGSASVAGTAAQVTAIVRGTSSLDAFGLKAKDATIGAEGNAVVRIAATNSAKVEAQGTATVELDGRPGCTIRANGSAVVSGCR